MSLLCLLDTNLARRLAVALLLAAALGACQRSTPPANAPTTAPAVTTAPTTPAPAATTTGDDAPPEGVLRAYVWDCPGAGKLVLRNLFREHAIAIDFHEGTQRLDQVVSASGARYANAGETIVFWTKGATATLQRAGAPAFACTELRAESLREDARLRGVVYRALGNEPGWTLEVGPGGRLEWNTNYGQDRYSFDGAIEAAGGDAATRTFTATQGEQSVEVKIRAEPCTDDAGVAYELAATIESAGGALRGCATRLN